MNLENLRRAIFSLYLLLFLSAPAIAQQVQLVSCTASRSPSTPIAIEECRNLWRREAYLRVGYPMSLERQKRIRDFERAALSVENFVEWGAHTYGLVEAVVGKEVLEAKITKIVSNVAGIALATAPVEGSITGEIAQEWIGIIHESLFAIALDQMGATPTMPIDDIVRLLNASTAWFNQVRINGMWSTSYTVDRYFEAYYLSGTGHESVLRLLGLTSGTADEVLYEALYDEYQMSGPVSAKQVKSAISHTISLIDEIAETRLARDIAAEASSTSQQIVGHFSGRVTRVDLTGNSTTAPGGIGVNDPVTVEVLYHAASAYGAPFEDGQINYTFESIPDRNQILVTINGNDWKSRGRLHLRVTDDSPSGKIDKVHLFSDVDAPFDSNSNWVMFRIGGSSIPDMMFNPNLPMSLGDFNFSGAASPDCCIDGEVSGSVGSAGSPDYQSWWISISIDRSTFELGPAVP